MINFKMLTAAEARKTSDKNKQNKLIKELESIQQGIQSQSSRGNSMLVRAEISEEAKTILIEHGYTIEISEISEVFISGINIIIRW